MAFWNKKTPYEKARDEWQKSINDAVRRGADWRELHRLRANPPRLEDYPHPVDGAYPNMEDSR